MFYNEKVLTNTTPSVGIYEGNQGQAFFMKEGKKLKDEAAREAAEAKKDMETAHKLNLSQGMNALANDDQLMSNPQALGAEMDKLAKGIVSEINDDDIKLSILTDYEISKGSMLNKATANMKRIQAENNRALTYDSVYKGIDSLGTSFGNAITGEYDDNDIVNFQYSLNNIKKNINARNLDGTFMFTDAQRRAMAKEADGYMISSFVDSYSKLPEAKRAAIASKLENDYFRISLGDDGFKYKGTIDLDARPVYKNKDGSVSTEVSKIFEFDGEYVILPTIKTVNGQRVDMTDEEAIEEAKQSKQHLGVYKTRAEAEKASQAIHERGENGVDLRDVVGEETYRDIKRAVAKYDSEYKAELVKQFNWDGKMSIRDFVSNPTEAGLNKVYMYHPNMSETTKAKYREILDNDPVYVEYQKTMYADAEAAKNAVLEFADTDFNSDDSRDAALIDVVSKINKSYAGGKLKDEEVSNLKSDLLTTMIDDNVRENMREMKPFYDNFWKEIFTISPTYDRAAVKKRLEDMAEPLQRQVIDGISRGASAEEMKLLLKQSRRKFINFKYPPIEGKEIGDILSLNGVPYKVISIEPVPTLEPVK